MPPKRKRQPQPKKETKVTSSKMQLEEPIDAKIEAKLEENIVKEKVRKRTRSKKEDVVIIFNEEQQNQIGKMFKSKTEQKPLIY